MADSAWRDLSIRVISAAILMPVCLYALWLGGPAWAIWLAALVTGLGGEWAGLCGIKFRSPSGVAIPCALLLAGLAARWVSPLAGLGVLVAGMALLGALSRRGVLGLGILYIGPAYLSLLLLRAGAAGLRNVLFVLVVVWAGDIGAYLVGRLVGGPRLAPKISPGKTWAGAIGGTLAAILAGAAAGYEQPLQAALVALPISLVAQAGDLAESAIKRHFGAKDSGWIIPGHGGLLDRLDGVLAAAPISMLWSLIIGMNNVLWH
jgi:phosphatidate cytidylyltransferase